MQSKYMHVHQIVVISFLLHYVIVFSSGEGDVKTSCIRISLICPVSPKIDVLQISSHHSYSSLARVDASPIPSRVERSGSGVGGGEGSGSPDQYHNVALLLLQNRKRLREMFSPMENGRASAYTPLLHRVSGIFWGEIFSINCGLQHYNILLNTRWTTFSIS